MKFLLQLLLCIGIIYLALDYFGSGDSIPHPLSSSFTYEVRDIVQDPGGFRGKTVRITGIARAPKKVFYWGGYILEDLNDPRVQIWVQPRQSSIIPEASEFVTIQGEVKQPIKWNDFELLLIKEVP